MRSKAHGWAALVAAVAAGSFTGARAQDAELFAEDLVAGTRVLTVLEAGVDYTDNFYYTSNDRKDSGSGFIVRPQVLATHVLPRFRFFGGAQAEFGWFDRPGDYDDYADYELSLGSEWQPAARHRFNFTARHTEDHDPFGTERTELTPLVDRDVDQWRENRVDATYYYGLPTEKYNIELRTYGRNREYTNNRDLTRFLDREAVNGQVTAFYNIGPKSSLMAAVIATRVTAELRPGDEGAPAGLVDRSRNELRYLLGTRWAATRKTSGDVRLGYIERRPRDGARAEFNAFDWRASLSWSPRSVTGLTLETLRSTQDSYLPNVRFIDIRYASLEWSEQWTQRMSTRLAGRHVWADFVGVQREDESFGFTLAGEYQLTRHLKLLGLANTGHRESNVGFAEYDRYYVYLGARYAR